MNGKERTRESAGGERGREGERRIIDLSGQPERGGGDGLNEGVGRRDFPHSDWWFRLVSEGRMVLPRIDDAKRRYSDDSEKGAGYRLREKRNEREKERYGDEIARNGTERARAALWERRLFARERERKKHKNTPQKHSRSIG